MTKQQGDGLLIKESTRSYLKELIFVTGIICTIVSTGYSLILLPKIKSEISLETSPIKDDVMFLKILSIVKSTTEEIEEANRRMKFYKENGQTK